MNPELEQMDLKQLRAYVLSHYEDEAAFHLYIDRCKAANPNRTKYPPANTPEGYKIMQQAIRKKLGIPEDQE